MKKKLLFLTILGLGLNGCKTRQLSDSSNSEVFQISRPSKQGDFKIGMVADDFLNAKKGFSLAQAIKTYTQDIENPTRIGDAYFQLPKSLKLQTSQKNYWIDINKNPDYQKAIVELQNQLYAISIENEKANIATANNARLISLPLLGRRELYGTKGKPSAFVKLLFQNIKDKSRVNINELFGLYVATITMYQKMNLDESKWEVVLGSHDTGTAGTTKASDLEIKFASATSTNQAFALSEKNYDQLIAKSVVKKTLIDNTLELKNSYLDSLYISTQDGIVNHEDFYKDFVTDNNFSDTNIFLIGKNAQKESGSSDQFASSNISTASFSEYLAAYTAGFQAAISQINYNVEEKEYEKTNVGFFIASTTSGKSKKKANAFKKGVIAASQHTKYAPFLNVTFVDKSHDDSEKTKKLYYSIDNWKEDHKIANFINSDSFTDADNQVMYLAGSTISDWKGSTTGGTNDNAFEENENFGLIGSIYKYNKTGVSTRTYSSSRKFKLILDQSETENTGQIGQSWTETNQDDKDALQRHNIKVLGFIGGENQGIMAYAMKSIIAQYLGGEDYMLGKHTLFGSTLDYQSLDSKSQFAYFNQKRYFDALLDSFDQELFEDVITT